MKYKYNGSLTTPEFIKFINDNGFTLGCCNCFISNGECGEIAGRGKCACYNNSSRLRKLLKNNEKEKISFKIVDDNITLHHVILKSGEEVTGTVSLSADGKSICVDEDASLGDIIIFRLDEVKTIEILS